MKRRAEGRKKNQNQNRQRAKRRKEQVEEEKEEKATDGPVGPCVAADEGGDAWSDCCGTGSGGGSPLAGAGVLEGG